MLPTVLANGPCTELLCLYSEKCEANYDMWFDVLTPLPAAAYQGRCPSPTGGQVRQALPHIHGRPASGARGGAGSIPTIKDSKASSNSNGKSGSSRPEGSPWLSRGPAVEISFILSVHNNIRMATQCLIELFRTAGEAVSAEFIVIDDGSTDDTSLLTDTVYRLTAYFDAGECKWECKWGFRHLRLFESVSSID